MTQVEQAGVDVVGKAADLPISSTGCGHSAIVRMNLHIEGNVLAIGQMGPDFLILPDRIEHPPTEAEIDMWIDDHHRRWPVYLVDGISKLRDRTKIAKVHRSQG